MIAPITFSRSAADACDDAPDIAALTEPIISLLDELAQVIAALRAEQYAQKPVGVMPSSVGGHVRHSLDHVRALIASVSTGQLNYDHRDRGTRIETDRQAALDEIDALISELRSLPHACCDLSLALSMKLMADREALMLATCFPREAGYVLSHTIHHNAIIGAMVRTLGGHPPATFGYAPSTLAYRSAACVR